MLWLFGFYNVTMNHDEISVTARAHFIVRAEATEWKPVLKQVKHFNHQWRRSCDSSDPYVYFWRLSC